MKPLLCFLLVLCVCLNASGKRTEKRKYVSIRNKAKNEALVDCTAGNGIFKKLLKPGEKILWRLPKGTGGKSTSMICHVDIRNEDHVHGYFSAFLHKTCKNKCRWRILDDWRVQLKLTPGKWKTFKLEQNKEDARISGDQFCGVTSPDSATKRGKHKSENCGGDSCNDDNPVSSPGKDKSLPVPLKKREQHGPKEGDKCLGYFCPKEGRASPPKRSTEGTTKPKEQKKCTGASCKNSSQLSPPPTKPKQRGKLCIGGSCGSNGKIAPAPTNQKQPQQQPKKCDGKSCGKDTKVLPPAKQTSVSKEAKKCDVKVAPPPTQQKSRDTKSPPPTEGKSNSRNAKKCAGDLCGGGAKLAPAPSKQKSQQSTKCDGISCGGKTILPPPVSGQGKSRGPGAELVPPPRKEARPPTTKKGKERSTVPDGKLAPPPTKQKSKQPKKCESISCEKTDKQQHGKQTHGGYDAKHAPPPSNQKSEGLDAKLAPPPNHKRSKGPKTKLASPPTSQNPKGLMKNLHHLLKTKNLKSLILNLHHLLQTKTLKVLM